ncbi:YbaB/EbfC family nucleoid-associated protein [Amycolatopsis sp. NPDC051758]|uniref:YbaB/EbfC family nucleoid-associated protein n=1 Tax=Amycolatopsis sp. NPDC051758 TaxID=3363935 RepID=UPI0037B72164
MTPEEWLAGFETKIADVREKAEQFRVGLEAAGTTVASPDGTIRVGVAPNGSLTDLQLTDSALTGKSGAKLAEEILKLARKAQRDAAVNVAAAFEPLGGDSEAMHMVTGYLPPEEPEEPPAPEAYQERRLWQHEEPEAAPPPPPPPPVRRPARPVRDDDDDFGDNTFMRRD